MNPDRPGPLKIWITAVRPFAYSASMTAVLLGIALAYYEGHPFHWGHGLLTFLGVIAFHTAANLLNDRYDFERGNDRVVLPMSGALVRGWLSPTQITRAALVFLLLGIGVGLYLTIRIGWPILVLGIVGTAITLSYTRSGYCLKYAALGDPAIFLAFGLLPVLGAYYVQTGTFGLRPVLWCVPLAAYTVGILHANNWHDLETDPQSGCRTIAGLLGDRRSALYYRLLVLGPFFIILLYVALGEGGIMPFRTPSWIFLVFSLFPAARRLARIDGRHDREAFLKLDGLTARFQTFFGILLSLAFVLGGWWMRRSLVSLVWIDRCSVVIIGYLFG